MICDHNYAIVDVKEVDAVNHNLFTVNNCFKFLFEIYGNDEPPSKPNRRGVLIVHVYLINIIEPSYRVIVAVIF